MDASASLVFLVILAVFVYFIPTTIAVARSHHNGVPVFLLNLFLGWTFIGWVAALIWSTMAVIPAPPASRPPHDTGGY